MIYIYGFPYYVYLSAPIVHELTICDKVQLNSSTTTKITKKTVYLIIKHRRCVTADFIRNNFTENCPMMNKEECRYHICSKTPLSESNLTSLEKNLKCIHNTLGLTDVVDVIERSVDTPYALIETRPNLHDAVDVYKNILIFFPIGKTQQYVFENVRKKTGFVNCGDGQVFFRTFKYRKWFSNKCGRVNQDGSVDIFQSFLPSTTPLCYMRKFLVPGDDFKAVSPNVFLKREGPLIFWLIVKDDEKSLSEPPNEIIYQYIKFNKISLNLLSFILKVFEKYQYSDIEFTHHGVYATDNDTLFFIGVLDSYVTTTRGNSTASDTSATADYIRHLKKTDMLIFRNSPIMFSRAVTLMDIYLFCTVYNNSSIEHLLQWLMQFTEEDQLDVIGLIENRFKKKWWQEVNRQYIKTHGDCNCPKYYKVMCESFKLHVSSENVGKCVNDGDFIMQQLTSPPLLSMANVIELESSSTSTTYRLRYIKPMRILGEFDMNVSDLEKNSKRQYDRHGDSLKLADLNLLPLNAILAQVSICELYGLFIMPFVLTKFDFERLVPEYWRSNDRSAACETRNVNIKLLHAYTYAFHSQRKILLSNTLCRCTFKLRKPKHITLHALQAHQLSKYIVQKNYNGFRVILCKSDSAKMYTTNRHGVKVPIAVSSTAHFGNVNNFTAECLLVPYDDVGRALRHSSFHHHHHSQQRFKIVLVDLFIYNGVNLLVNNYANRFEIMRRFVEKVDNEDVVLGQVATDTELLADFEREYETLLRTQRPYFNGLVLRRKSANCLPKNLKFKYEMCKIDVFTRSRGYLRILKNDDDDNGLALTLRSDGLVLPFYHSKYVMVILAVCYNKDYWFCAFRDFIYVPFQKIQFTKKQEKLPQPPSFQINRATATSSSRMINVDNHQVPWFPLKVMCNSISDQISDIVDIQYRPDYSLLDCITWPQLLMLNKEH